MDTREMLTSSFKKKFNCLPDVIIKAPGRINLIGEHTDYNNGFVLPAAINKAVHIAFSVAEKNTGKWYAADLDKHAEIDFNNIAPVQNGWENYLLGVIDQYNKKGLPVPAFNCIITSDVPVGSGLSSSAALEVATAIGIQHLNNYNLGKLEIAKMCQAAEHEYAGAKVGIMDMFASLHGKKDHVILLDCKTLEHHYYNLNIKGYSIVLLDTNVKHTLASSEYNVRRKQCEEGIAILKNFNNGIESLRDVTMEFLKEHEADLSPVVYKRCYYVVDEIARTIAATKDLTADNIPAFGKKMYETHEGLSNLYEVSCPELDFLVASVKNNKNVLGARMMGGGFGGCTINIIKDNEEDEIYNSLKTVYEEKFDRPLKMYKVSVDDGAHALP